MRKLCCSHCCWQPWLRRFGNGTSSPIFLPGTHAAENLSAPNRNGGRGRGGSWRLCTGCK